MTEHQWEPELSVVCPYDTIIWRGWAPPGAQPQALSRKKLPACVPPPPPKPPPPVPRLAAAPPPPPPMPARATPARKPPAPPRPPPPVPDVPLHRPLEPLHLLRNLGVPLVLPAPKRTVRRGWTRHAPWLAAGVALVVSAAFTVPPLVAHLRRSPIVTTTTQTARQPPAAPQVSRPAPAPAVPDIPITIKVERPRPVAAPLTRRSAQTWRLAPSLVASIRRAKRRARPRKHVRVRVRRRPRVSSRVDADALLAAGQQ